MGCKQVAACNSSEIQVGILQKLVIMSAGIYMYGGNRLILEICTIFIKMYFG